MPSMLLIAKVLALIVTAYAVSPIDLSPTSFQLSAISTT